MRLNFTRVRTVKNMKIHVEILEMFKFWMIKFWMVLITRAPASQTTVEKNAINALTTSKENYVMSVFRHSLATTVILRHRAPRTRAPTTQYAQTRTTIWITSVHVPRMISSLDRTVNTRDLVSSTLVKIVPNVLTPWKIQQILFADAKLDSKADIASK